MTDLDELLALAEAATPGRVLRYAGSGHALRATTDGPDLAHYWSKPDALMAYALDPETVKALIAGCRRAEALDVQHHNLLVTVEAAADLVSNWREELGEEHEDLGDEMGDLRDCFVEWVRSPSG